MKNKIITIITMIALVSTLIMPVNVEAKTAPKLNKRKVTLTITQKKTKPTYKLKVKNASGKIKWKTSNKKIATVNNTGKVTAKKKGNAIITAKVGRQTLRCRVTVKDNRKTVTPASTKTSTPASVVVPIPIPTQKCDHTYEDHWVTFEEYYETNNDIQISCNCGVFTNIDEYQKHVMVLGIHQNNFTINELEMGLHGKCSKHLANSITIDDKTYLVIKTEYIDKRTCIKCGHVINEMWDSPKQMKTEFSNGRAIPVDPYAASVLPEIE